MKELKKLFDEMGRRYSGPITEYYLNEDGLICDKKGSERPWIIPGVTERDVKIWFYDSEQPTYWINERGIMIEWDEIEIDQEMLKDYYDNHIAKPINDDGTF